MDRSTLLDMILRRRRRWTPLALKPTLWLDPSQGVFTDSAGSFASASSQYLSVASNGTLQASSDTWGSAWVYQTSVDVGPVMAKWNGAASGGYLFYTDSGNRIVILVANSSSTQFANSSAISSVPANTWTHVFWYKDSATNNLNTIVNGVASTPTTMASDIRADALEFKIGGDGLGRYQNGLIESVVFGKSPPGGFAATPAATIAAALYNSGNGLKPQQISSAQRTAWGVVSGWLGNAAQSLVADSIGSNTLTNNNAVTVGAGAILTPASIGDAVAAWRCRATGILFTQATLANRPTLQVVGGRLVVRFDSSNDYLSNAAFVWDNRPFTLVASLNPNVYHHNSVILSGDATNSLALAVANSPATNAQQFAYRVNVAGFAITSGVIPAARSTLSYWSNGVSGGSVTVSGRLNGGSSASTSFAGLGAATGSSIGGVSFTSNPLGSDVYGLQMYSRNFGPSAELTRLERWASV